MRENYFLPLALLAMSGLATACAPTFYADVRPARASNLFVEGREQAQAFTADSVEVRLNFVGFEASRMVFEAVYRNPTARRQPLVVAPAEFAYEPRRVWSAPGVAWKKPVSGAQVTATIAAAAASRPLPALPAQPLAAFDPEPEITALCATAEREAARASRFDWLGAALAITSVAADVASISKKETPGQAQSRAALHEAAVSYQIASTATKVGHAIAAEQLHLRALNLQDYALRKVTLEPGQQVRGFVYFPRFDAADTMRVLAPVPGGSLPLDFVQTHTRR